MGMKAKPMKPKRGGRVVDYLDALDHHRANACAVAGLLELCRTAEQNDLNPQTLGDAAELITNELKEVARLTFQIGEELQR